MNISFVKLGEEECEECREHAVHKEVHPQHDNNDEPPADCEECSIWIKHMNNAREAYRNDKESELSNDECLRVCGYAENNYAPQNARDKKLCFHKTFSAIQWDICSTWRKAKSSDPVISILWDENMSGRNAEDMATAYVQYMRQPQTRDKRKCTFWMDNCTSQNKNWTIYTAMVDEVNRPGGPEEIVFKYFEKGHTFMSADSFHHLVVRRTCMMGQTSAK